jgi:hypothetical protein
LLWVSQASARNWANGQVLVAADNVIAEMAKTMEFLRVQARRSEACMWRDAMLEEAGLTTRVAEMSRQAWKYLPKCKTILHYQRIHREIPY